MALTKATYSLIEGTPLNLFDFGVVGDGVADDTAAIQAAINALGAQGRGSLTGPNDVTYKITATLDFTVLGVGAGGKVLVYRDPNTTTLTGFDVNLQNLDLGGPRNMGADWIAYGY